MDGPPGPFTPCSPLCADDRWISSSRPAPQGPSPGQSALDARSAGRVGAWIEHPGTDPGTAERCRYSVRAPELEHRRRVRVPHQTEARELTSIQNTPITSSAPPAPELE